ncbi:MAG: hypothetical protein ACHRXM_17430 [Isosphaerales bacterium]
MNQAVPRVLVPPRPNLGPEPWPGDQPIAWILGATGAVASLVLAWFFWSLIRRGRARSRRTTLASRNGPDPTPRGQFVALSDSIREVLIRQFGTAWRAKTTEELSADAQLEHALGREPLQELIRFLDQVDHLKFAPERSNHHDESLQQELATWQPRVADLLKTIQAKPDGRFRLQGDTSSLVNRTPSMSVR